MFLKYSQHIQIHLQCETTLMTIANRAFHPAKWLPRDGSACETQHCCHQNLIKEFSCGACMSILQRMFTVKMYLSYDWKRANLLEGCDCVCRSANEWGTIWQNKNKRKSCKSCLFFVRKEKMSGIHLATIEQLPLHTHKKCWFLRFRWTIVKEKKQELNTHVNWLTNQMRSLHKIENENNHTHLSMLLGLQHMGKKLCWFRHHKKERVENLFKLKQNWVNILTLAACSQKTFARPKRSDDEKNSN